MRAYSLAGAAVTRALGRSLERMNCPVLLIEPPGRVSRVNLAARALLRGAPASNDVRALLGVSFAELSESVSKQRDMVDVVLPTSGQPQRVRIEPIESAGRLIALLAFLEPLAKVQTRSPRPAQAASDPFRDIFAEDSATRAALDWAARIAPSDIPVMLLAETGAGKELVARALHSASRRAQGPFVAVNCGSFTATLLESELFGYGPGAFSGAERAGRHGYFHAASGGTLFLDEVAEMPLAMQAALLRVLETGSYQRVGETRAQRADVRVVCATCRNLGEMVARGEFRNDLYFRLKGATVTLPPLRDRHDIAALSTHLIHELAHRRDLVPAPELSPEVVSLLQSFPWPGNVRELKSTLDIALVLADQSPSVEIQHLPPDLAAAAPGIEAPPKEKPLADVQGWAVRRALAEVAGNVSLAAKRLGVARSTLYRMMRRHGLTEEQW